MFLTTKCLTWQYFVFFLFCSITFGYSIFLISNSYKNESKLIPRKSLEFNKEVEIFLTPKTLKLKNFLNDDKFLRNENFKKIFFVETHMEELRVIDKPRQACSVESAALTNPDAKVYLILITNSTSVSLKYSELTKVLLSYKNINFRFLNPYEFSKGSAIEHLIASDIILGSKYHIEHMSDAMRTLILSKYPGLYLDLDVVSLVNSSKVEFSNFACAQEKNLLGNAVIHIDRKGLKVFDVNLRKFNASYNPNVWAVNGPMMFSDSVRSFCPNKDIETNKYTTCNDFTIMPTKKCYPIGYPEFSMFYTEDGVTKALRRIQESESYFIHIWNKMQEFGNTNYKMSFNSSAAYVELAKALCPRVLKTVEKYF